MRYILYSLATLWLLPVAVRAELHEFRNAQGQTIRAEIQAATSEQVSIKLENGRTMLVNNSLFVEEDQKFILKWIEEHPTQLKLNAKFEEKPEDEEEDDSGSAVTTTELTRYDIHLRNGEPVPVTGCEIHYEIFKKKAGTYSSSANQGSFTELGEYFVQYGTEQMDDLAPNGTTLITTDLIIVNDFEPKGGAKGGKEDLMGIWIRILNEKKQVVYEAKSSEAKLKNAEWYDPYAKDDEEEKAEQ